MYEYNAKIIRWLDGDSLDVELDLGVDTLRRMRVRLACVNAPEVHSKDPDEKERGLAALAFASALAPPGSAVRTKTDKPKEKFGRYLARIWTASGKDVAVELIAAQLARAWDGSGERPI